MPQTLSFEDNSILPLLFGEHNAHLRTLEDHFDLKITHRGNNLFFEGDDHSIDKTQHVFDFLLNRIQQNQPITNQDVHAAIRFVKNEGSAQNANGTKSHDIEPIRTSRQNTIVPRSPKQAAYIQAMREKDMVFGIGPGGTGKTYLAVALGVSLYLNGDVERLIFCRPAVEAGERLGFLPGDMQDKIDPYLRPIYDALYDVMPSDKIARKIAAGDIEIAPLAFMRGRTLKNAFVILDEAQNTTSTQMKMFLTRMGEGTHMVITGDPSQIDLPGHMTSGLNEALEILQKEKDIGFIKFKAQDVVRHGLVEKIINAYDRISGQKND